MLSAEACGHIGTTAYQQYGNNAASSWHLLWLKTTMWISPNPYTVGRWWTWKIGSSRCCRCCCCYCFYLFHCECQFQCSQWKMEPVDGKVIPAKVNQFWVSKNTWTQLLVLWWNKVLLQSHPWKIKSQNGPFIFSVLRVYAIIHFICFSISAATVGLLVFQGSTHTGVIRELSQYGFVSAVILFCALWHCLRAPPMQQI